EECAAGLQLDWALLLEQGETRRGSLLVQPHEGDARRAIDGRQRVRRGVVLPVPLPLGYHRLRVRGPGLADAETTLIVVPRRCYVPEALRSGERGWGLTVQLYTLRTGR